MKRIIKELKKHIPFTFIAIIFAIILIVFIKFILLNEIPKTFFYILHPMHLFVSAIVTASIYYKYKKKIIFAFLIGITGSIIIGSISDILIPFLGGNIFNFGTQFHLPILENTLSILLIVIIGSVLGIMTGLTKIPHFIHVFFSIFASLFYLLSFSGSLNLINFIAIFFIVFIAVLIPCCISDIIYPLLFVSKNK